MGRFRGGFGGFDGRFAGWRGGFGRGFVGGYDRGFGGYGWGFGCYGCAGYGPYGYAGYGGWGEYNLPRVLVQPGLVHHPTLELLLTTGVPKPPMANPLGCHASRAPGSVCVIARS